MYCVVRDWMRVGGYQSFLTFPLKFKLSLTMMRDVELAEESSGDTTKAP